MLPFFEPEAFEGRRERKEGDRGIKGVDERKGGFVGSELKASVLDKSRRGGEDRSRCVGQRWHRRTYFRKEAPQGGPAVKKAGLS